MRWINNLKKGDEVFVRSSGAGKKIYFLRKVKKVTKNKVVVGNAVFDRLTGKKTTQGRIYKHKLLRPTPDRKDKHLVKN